MSANGLQRRLATNLAAVAILFFAIFTTFSSLGAVSERDNSHFAVSKAVLQSRQPKKTVYLPYVRQPQDFERDGSLVTFVLNVPMEKAPHTDMGIYIEKVSLSGQVIVNGQSLGNCQAAAVEKLRCLHQPQFFIAGKSIWRAGDNELRVIVYANKNQPNGLSRVVLGSDAYIYSNFYRPAKLWSYDFIIAMQWMMLLLGLGLFLIGSVTKSSLYTLFGISSILYALSSLNSVMEKIYVSEAFASWFIYSIRMSSIAFLLAAMLSFFDVKMKRLNQLLISVAFLFPAVVALSSNDRAAVIALYAPLLLLATICLFLVAKATYQKPTQRRVFFCLTFFGCFIAGPFDYFVLSGSTAFEQRYLIVYTNAFLLFALGGLLVKDLADAHIAAQAANDVLRSELKKQEQELVSTHNQVLALEKLNSRVKERERLLREVHDGFGTTLSAAYVRLCDGPLSSENAKTLISDCISDLRIVLSVTDPYATFQDAIAELRSRIQSILANKTIQMKWNVRLDGMPVIDTSTALDLVRIMQEAVSNAIKHSAASLIEVHCVYNDEMQQLDIHVNDNGTGFDVGATTLGRGIRNMKRRASMIGAAFDVRTLDTGTEIRLRFSCRVGAVAIDEQLT